MRLILLAALLTIPVGAASGRAQSLLGSKPSPQYATVSSSATSASAAPGATVTLWVDVVPNPKIHIYAEGARDFTPVSLVLTPNPTLSAGKVVYPKPSPIAVPGTSEQVPAYDRPFRIAVPVTIKNTAKPGETLTIGAALNYQACDDRLCYPATVAPALWKIAVR